MIGVKGSWTGQNIPSLAHELAGHWVDNEAGTAMSEQDSKFQPVNVYNRSSRKPVGASSMLSEMDNRHDASGERNNLIKRASLLMNGSKYNPKIDKALKAKNDDIKNLPEEEQRFVEITRTVFGNYWYSPREVFARLVEQYVSEKLNGNAVVSAQKSYRDIPAYWSKENFEALLPDLEKAIAERFKLVAQKLDVEYAEVVAKPEEPAAATKEMYGNEVFAQVVAETDSLEVKFKDSDNYKVDLEGADADLVEKLETALELVDNQPLAETNAEEYETLAELREDAKSVIKDAIEQINQVEESLAPPVTADSVSEVIVEEQIAEPAIENEIRVWKSKPVSLLDIQGNSTKEKAASYQKELAVRKLSAEFLNKVENNDDDLPLVGLHKDLAVKMMLVGESFDENFSFEDVIERAKKFSYEVIERIEPEKLPASAAESETAKDEAVEEERNVQTEQIIENPVVKQVVAGSEEFLPKGTFAFAEHIKTALDNEQPLGNNTNVAHLAQSFFGSHVSSGLYSSQDIYNAVELGANLWVKDNAANLMALNEYAALEKLKKNSKLAADAGFAHGR